MIIKSPFVNQGYHFLFMLSIFAGAMFFLKDGTKSNAQSGVIKRWEALAKMHDQYGIFDDHPDLLAKYVYELDYQREYRDALLAIQADIVDQLEGISFDFLDNYTATTLYKNNTPYDFDVQFYLTWYTEDNVRIDSSSKLFENIEKGSTIKLSFYYPWNKMDGGYKWSATFEIWPKI